MSLDYTTRGIVEQEVENAINDIPDMMELYRQPNKRSLYQYKDESDFILGLSLGRVLFVTICNFKIKFLRSASSEEVAEIRKIIDRRTPELREAIFRVG